MAYDSATLSLISAAPLTGAGKRWRHQSTDASAAVDAAYFITDAGARGMAVGDIVEHRDTTNNIISSHRVVSITTNSTYPNGAADLGNGTVIGLDTNSD